MFRCCHRVRSLEALVARTSRSLTTQTTADIAGAFLVLGEKTAKRSLGAAQKIRDAANLDDVYGCR